MKSSKARNNGTETVRGDCFDAGSPVRFTCRDLCSINNASVSGTIYIVDALMCHCPCVEEIHVYGSSHAVYPPISGRLPTVNLAVTPVTAKRSEVKGKDGAEAWQPL